MDEKMNMVRQVAEAIVTAVRNDTSVVIFVRCDTDATMADADDTFMGYNKHINWVPVSLKKRDNPLKAFAIQNRTSRTVFLIREMDDHAMQVLNTHRQAYDDNKLQAVFLLAADQVRTFARVCPEFWAKRGAFVAWPSTASNDDAELEKEQSYKKGVVRGIERRMENALNQPAGMERGKAIFTACRDAFYNGHTELAAEHMVSAINELRNEGKAEEMAEAFQILGAVSETRGDARSGLDWYGESLRFWQESGSPEGLSSIYTSIGQIYYRIDEVQSAGENLQQALELEETLNRPIHLCDICRMLAMVKERQDATTDAMKLLERSETLADTMGDEARVGMAMHHRARVQERLARWAEAKDLYHKVLTIRERLRDTRGMATTLHQLGNVFFNQAEHEMSISCYERAITIERELDDVQGLASSLLQVAHVAEERFQHDVAFRALTEARPILKKLHSPLIPDADKRLKRIGKLMTRSEMRRIQEEVEEGGVIGSDKDRPSTGQTDFSEDISG